MRNLNIYFYYLTLLYLFDWHIQVTDTYKGIQNLNSYQNPWSMWWSEEAFSECANDRMKLLVDCFYTFPVGGEYTHLFYNSFFLYLIHYEEPNSGKCLWAYLCAFMQLIISGLIYWVTNLIDIKIKD